MASQLHSSVSPLCTHLAVHSLLFRAQLVQLGPQANVAVLNGSQLHLLIPAALADLVLVETQALVHTALTCKHFGAGMLPTIAYHIHIYVPQSFQCQYGSHA